MGREWLHWGSSSNGGKSTKRLERERERERDSSTANGCMNAVFQLFDLHPFQFSLHHHQPSSSFKPDSFLPEEPTTLLKGVEAPRNSLETENAFMEAAPLSSSMKEDLNIPIMGIQIKTTPLKPCDSCSDSGNSPATKTPNLVARLMGLDLLPENCSSPSLSLSSSKNRLISGTVSLPETPRVSSARRSDVGHRLSLQINKENSGEELEFSGGKNMGRRRDQLLQEGDNRSPGHYARQAVKQIKERVSRRVGNDITNTVKNREQIGREEKLNRAPAKIGSDSNPIGKNKQVKPPFNSPKQSCSSPLCSSPMINQKTIQAPVQDDRPTRYSRRIERVPRTSDGIRNKKEETFVRPSATNMKAKLTEKKCKRTALSKQLVNSNGPTFLPVRKETSSPVKQLPHQQVQSSQVSDALSSKTTTQLSCSSTHLYLQEPTHRSAAQDHRDSTAATSSNPESHYIARILKRTGIDRDTLVSSTKWYASSHPLDPSIFHLLELSPIAAGNSVLTRRCDRKLIFQLVDELLVEIVNPWKSRIARDWGINGSKLIETLSERIRRFPSADCRVLEDIDALIEKDLRRIESKSSIAFEEEGETIASEIEREIVDTLVEETAMAALGGGKV